MFYYSEAELDQLLLDGTIYGDLTSRSLGIENLKGILTFTLTEKACVSGIELSKQLLKKMNLTILEAENDSTTLDENTKILSIQGTVSKLHQTIKTIKNILEWSTGICNYTRNMVEICHQANPLTQIACTRKSIPGSKKIAIEAILNGGGILYRTSLSDTILLLESHRIFYDDPNNWIKLIHTLREKSPNKSIAVEVNNLEDAQEALKTEPNILQVDKFLPEEIKTLIKMANKEKYATKIVATGGINLNTVSYYAKTGAHILCTSAPFYAKPIIIDVDFKADNNAK